ncbi:MAG: malate synthase A [Actinomycetota bacterium]|nr:malate synthase A [Actinomycetota bacterium]
MTSQIRVKPSQVDGHEAILTKEAIDFVAHLNQKFHARRDEFLKARKVRRDKVGAGGTLDFLPETKSVREGDWKVAPAPAALNDRRVEMTGPATPKMAINAMNSGAKVWLADLEDSSTPHWHNVIESQVVLRGVIRRDYKYTDPNTNKEYKLNSGKLSTIVMRPRGWHFDERNMRIDGKPVVAAIFDFAMYFFHNAKALIELGEGPYFYLPKMESHLEARLWNEIFMEAQRLLGIPHGTIRATVLIETIPAAFEMDEILYELKDHMSGLNAGRWDYLFSMIKVFRDRGVDFLIPDRGQVAMTAPMMRAYTDLLVQTCHKRGAFAIGGMAAFVPSRKDEAINKVAFEKVRADKTRESGDGFDGSWVAHPDLVPLCREVFDSVLGDKPNQLDKQRPEVHVTADDLLAVNKTPGAITQEGLRLNIDVSLQYLAAWLGGNGAVAIHNLMEDAATVEISRSQIWQQIKNQVIYSDTAKVATKELAREIVVQESERLVQIGWQKEKILQAAQLFERVSLDDDYADFLTLPALEMIDV